MINLCATVNLDQFESDSVQISTYQVESRNFLLDNTCDIVPAVSTYEGKRCFALITANNSQT